MIFEYMEEIGRVLPVIDMNDTGPGPSEADFLEANRLEAAVKAGDPRVELVRSDLSENSVRVLWIG